MFKLEIFLKLGGKCIHFKVHRLSENIKHFINVHMMTLSPRKSKRHRSFKHAVLADKLWPDLELLSRWVVFYEDVKE